MTTVLITGAAGNVAGQLRPGLEGLDLRVTDRRPAHGWGAAEVVTGDLSDPAFAAAAVDGVDAVVHLAASPVAYAPWADLRGPNVDAVAAVLDAAAAAGVSKVVLATSVHVLGGYVLDGHVSAGHVAGGQVSAGHVAGGQVSAGHVAGGQVSGGDVVGGHVLGGHVLGGNVSGGHVRPGEVLVDPSWPARPCCRYGATKAFAEAYGSVVAATSGTSVLCLRLGLCLPAPTTTGNLAEWLGPADLRRLVRAALAADVRHGAYFGVSANTRRLFDLANARDDLGYEPLLDSEVFAGDVRPGPGGLCAVTPTPPPPTPPPPTPPRPAGPPLVGLRPPGLRPAEGGPSEDSGHRPQDEPGAQDDHQGGGAERCQT